VFDGFETRRVATSGAEINLRLGGSGPPLLLLHGYPQTHVMWHQVAPYLAERFTVAAADLRGYGDSAKPASDPAHAAYSKRAMAGDQVEAMSSLGFERFAVVGHDRGARVAHRMALDHPDRVERAAVLDICPTLAMYQRTDMAFASGYYHWFFLIQPYDLPERLIAADPDFYLESKTGGFGLGPRKDPSEIFDPEALEDYKRCFREPAAIHASCEDYRAAATIDLEHDRADLSRKVGCPFLALWGSQGLVGRLFDVLGLWRERADDVTGRSIDCGHYLAEEAPADTLAALQAFL
jgi:haloacetate dehalogenase